MRLTVIGRRKLSFYRVHKRAYECLQNRLWVARATHDICRAEDDRIVKEMILEMFKEGE